MTAEVLQYFRIEARELAEALGAGVLELERGPLPADRLAQLFRHAHTLKGAARVVKRTAIADLAHAIEEALAPYRDGARAVPRDVATALLRQVDAIAADLDAMDAPDGPAPDPALRSAVDDPTGALRVGQGELDALGQGLVEAANQIGGLQREVAVAEAARRHAAAALATLGAGDTRAARIQLEAAWRQLDALPGNLTARRDRARAEIEGARDRADKIRLVPAQTVFAALERAARDAAQDKRIVFEAAGGHHRLDAHVLSGVRDALLHIVRNAVTHGLETAAERVAAGKPPDGRVTVTVAQKGHEVAFVCKDDGRGIDVEAVRRGAIRLGLVSSAAASGLAPADVMRFVFRPGLSTAEAVTQTAGRGVGLDAAREAVARLRGDIAATSRPGAGTTFELRVPVTLASVVGVAVTDTGLRAILPLSGVVRTVRVHPEDRLNGPEGDRVIVEGEAVPAIPLRRLMGAATSEAPPGARSAVLVRGGGRLALLEVDRLEGTVEVVVKPLPAIFGPVAPALGASFDADGVPRPVLDPAAVVAVAHSAPAREVAPTAGPLAPVLVCDDSLTTRMLEQSILESAGYLVEVASSAEEALEMAARKRYSLFLVDVEMPGMDGFAFVEQTRADPLLRRTPAILVTSRSAAADRRRGEEVGASDFIVKSEFDQARLLATIRGLVG